MRPMHRSRVAFIIFLGGCLLLSACARPRVRYPKPGQTEEGIASYYDGEFVGRRTANGEIMDRDQLTAAHRTYVFGTVLRVTNLDNGLDTVVRINDRGPFVHGRIIDLTLAGARALDMIGSGIAKVRLEVLAAPPPGTPMWVQIGAFIDPDNAERLRRRCSDASFPVTVIVEGEFHKVRLGPCESERDARILAGRARKLDVPAIIVVEK